MRKAVYQRNHTLKCRACGYEAELSPRIYGDPDGVMAAEDTFNLLHVCKVKPHVDLSSFRIPRPEALSARAAAVRLLGIDNESPAVRALVN